MLNVEALGEVSDASLERRRVGSPVRAHEKYLTCGGPSGRSCMTGAQVSRLRLQPSQGVVAAADSSVKAVPRVCVTLSILTTAVKGHYRVTFLSRSDIVFLLR